MYIPDRPELYVNIRFTTVLETSEPPVKNIHPRGSDVISLGSEHTAKKLNSNKKEMCFIH
jgi:hypothetical protein